MHSIRNLYEEFDRRLYDNSEHRNLYVLDLNCDYAREVLRQAHSRKMFIAPAKWLLLQDRRTTIDGGHDDGSEATPTYDDSVLDIFENLAVYPDSDVVLALRLDGDFLELKSVYRPNPQRGAIWENRGNWTIENGLQMRTLDVASARRRNLHRTELKSCLVITDPDTMNHLTDFEKKTVDPVTKATYPWILHLVNRMNATVSFNITDSWGYRGENGSWNGMIGMLERREIDIGGTTTFFIPQRIGVVQYVQLYTGTRSAFVFRRPLLSTVKNIFVLPFQRNVWLAIAVFLLLVFCLLYLSMKWEHSRGASPESASYWSQFNSGKPAVGDNFLVLLGAFAQQGYAYEPYKVSTRIVTLMLLVASLSLYAAYTANIVGLLQSTTDSIRTLSDLLRSPLKLGAQDVVYSHHYFKAFRDPVRKAILEQRIEPKGRKPNWMTMDEGVRRVRNELFAFHGEIGAVYQLMQDTYLEEEKCGLTQIDYLNVLDPLLVVQMQSPYLEIIKNGALKLREYGLKYREEYRLYTEKPACTSETSFITIGLTECYFALVVMGYGMLLTAVVFALELLWHKKKNSREKDVVRTTQGAETPGAEAIDYAEYLD
ncbi:Glutamate receptor delta-2 subunit [Harpegnathos saltator]|uniref:Glutamate receptor delta-2 subunit n=1 Tax=Harpegnathos saltator TaxID=610380 RepID=E2B852_HARSA|nr:Glutamate receptor delta-2 subunit [Harpegnathos saltator]